MTKTICLKTMHRSRSQAVIHSKAMASSQNTAKAMASSRNTANSKAMASRIIITSKAMTSRITRTTSITAQIIPSQVQGSGLRLWSAALSL